MATTTFHDQPNGAANRDQKSIEAQGLTKKLAPKQDEGSQDSDEMEDAEDVSYEEYILFGTVSRRPHTRPTEAVIVARDSESKNRYERFPQ